MELLTPLLKQVSRSFYLTLRVLPGSIRSQIGLAYLLARATDTIADTEIVPLEQRLDALRQFREAIQCADAASPTPVLEFGELAKHQGLPAERVLLERCDEALSLLAKLSADDQHHVREVLRIITSGQELDLIRFSGASAGNIVALQRDDELDDYTYRVAGCVGEFWTRMCRSHVFPNARLDDAFLLAAGVRFGKGLQLVNILRDLPRDLRAGRCYVPESRLRDIGLTPKDLLAPAAEPKLRPLYIQYLRQAEAHLAAGWGYTNTLPWRAVRVRLACAWPILIGLKTCSKLRSGNVLDGQTPLKISRAEVRGVVVASVLLYPLPILWRQLGNSRAARGT
ncbi:MAG: squalene/phytoene synthase family protein, partial [Pedosphaera parvula]|nr:squalene/phytoene synthase family protein [Pedosphaera parvula]